MESVHPNSISPGSGRLAGDSRYANDRGKAAYC
jgi:hypothetical protein